MSRLHETAKKYDQETREAWNEHSKSLAMDAIEMAKLLTDMEQSKSDMDKQYKLFNNFIIGVQNVADKHGNASLLED